MNEKATQNARIKHTHIVDQLNLCVIIFFFWLLELLTGAGFVVANSDRPCYFYAYIFMSHSSFCSMPDDKVTSFVAGALITRYSFLGVAICILARRLATVETNKMPERRVRCDS